MFADPDVWSSVARLGNDYSGVPLAVEETKTLSMLGFKGFLHYGVTSSEKKVKKLGTLSSCLACLGHLGVADARTEAICRLSCSYG